MSMTEDEKSKRRSSIAEQVETKKTAKEMRYWMTRDRKADGTLEPVVDVWLSKPHWMIDCPGVWTCDAITVDTLNGEAAARFAQWTIQQCLSTCRVYPETERECLVVG